MWSNHRACAHKQFKLYQRGFFFSLSSHSHMHTCLNFQVIHRIRQPVGHVLFWAISRQKLICHLPLEAWFWSSVSSIISSTHTYTQWKPFVPTIYMENVLLGWVLLLLFSTLSLYSAPYLLLTELVCLCECVQYACVCVCFQSEIGTVVLLDAKMSV